MEKDKTTLTPSLQRLILERDEFTCTECRRQVPKVLLFIDRILSPESEEALGDVPEEDKYTCLCEECYKQAHSHLQIKAATRTAERRKQLEMMVEWRRENKSLASDTNAYLIDYINGKIEPYSLSKKGEKDIRVAVKKSNFTEALNAIDETFDRYVTYDNGEDLNEHSVSVFVGKIGGYLYINSLPPVEKEMYFILNSCKGRFRYWDQKRAKGYVQEYISALRSLGWSEERIYNDLKNELLRVSNEIKNWSDWRDTIVQWISDVRNLAKEPSKVQSNKDRLRYEGDTLTDTLEIDINFANEAWQVIKLFYDHYAGSTPEGWVALSSYVEDALLRFILDMREEFRSLKGIPLEKQDLLDGYIDEGAMYNLIHTYPIDEDFCYHPEPEPRPSDFPRDVQHHFLANGSRDLLHEIFWYFNLPQRRLDYQSDLEALDYFIKHYKEVFIIPEK